MSFRSRTPAGAWSGRRVAGRVLGGVLAALLPLGLVALGVEALSIAGARAARAEDGQSGSDDVSAKVKAQMEKIIELMHENEKALLELSTGKKAQTQPVDVNVTPPESPAGTPPSGSGDSSQRQGASGGSPPKTGEEVAREIKKLIGTQRNTGEKIPGELEELVRMVPQ